MTCRTQAAARRPESRRDSGCRLRPAASASDSDGEAAATIPGRPGGGRRHRGGGGRPTAAGSGGRRPATVTVTVPGDSVPVTQSSSSCQWHGLGVTGTVTVPS